MVHDLGARLGCGAHLTELRRTASGGFRLEEALDLDEIARLKASGREDAFLRPLESLLPELPRLDLDDESARRVLNGRAVQAAGIAAKARAEGPEDVFRFFRPRSPGRPGPAGAEPGQWRLSSSSPETLPPAEFPLAISPSLVYFYWAMRLNKTDRASGFPVVTNLRRRTSSHREPRPPPQGSFR
jgi:hypothetical protein